MLALRVTLPRGSRSSSLRMSSRSVARYRILSNMVRPGTSPTPPTITLPTSPSAWQPTTLNTLPKRTAAPYSPAPEI